MNGLSKTGLIGHPVAHSKSPLIHRHWIAAHGLGASYEVWDAPPADLESTVRRFALDPDFRGFNVTLPHKKTVFGLCDETDGIARAIGAVNAVSIENGKLRGTNTDAYGFIENIRAGAPAGFDLRAGPAVILGAGGAARAALYALQNEGVSEIRLLNRTPEKAEALAQGAANQAGVRVIDWDLRHDALEGANLLANTTSLGMNGYPPLDIHLDRLPRAALVNDIVYAPLYTDLLRGARGRGHPVVTGIGMLLHQARLAFQMWFGILPDIDQALMDKVAG